MSPRGAYVPLATSPTSPSAAAAALSEHDEHDPGLTHIQRVLSHDDGHGHGHAYSHEHTREHAVEVDEGAVVVPGEESVTPFVWGLVGAAAISGLLFGCVPCLAGSHWACRGKVWMGRC